MVLMRPKTLGRRPVPSMADEPMPPYLPFGITVGIGSIGWVSGRSRVRPSTRVSTRPVEFYLRALPEPCMNLSSHTAPDVRPLRLNGFASSTGSSCFQLASGQGRTTQPLHSSPVTGPSTLLRAAPPLCPASVLSPSRLEPLAASPFTSSDVTKHRFSRSIRKPGRASRRLHAGCRSGSIRASPELIPEEGSPPGSDIA